MSLAAAVITPAQRRRFELEWVAGVRGKPGVNGDIANADESIREIADPMFEVLGTNMTSALCTHRAEGGILLTTAGADNDQCFLLAHQDTSQSIWNKTWDTTLSWEWEMLMKTGSAITTVAYIIGMKSDRDEGVDDADLCVFNFNADDSDSNWGFISQENNTGGTDVDTTIAVAADTVYHLALKCGTDQIVRAYINGSYVGSQSFAGSGAELLEPFLCCQQLAGSITRDIVVYGQKLSSRYGIGA